jgi:hypothetical protein
LPDLSLYRGAILRKFALYLREYALLRFFFGIGKDSEASEFSGSALIPLSNDKYSSIDIVTSTISSTPCEACGGNSSRYQLCFC